MRILSVVCVAVVTASSAFAPQFAAAGDYDCESKSKWKCCCCCLKLAEPPRAEMAIAVGGRLNVESMFQQESDAQKETAEAQAQADERIDTLEKDLTRLTKIVEKMAESQSQIDKDLTRLTTLIEKIDSQTK